jgi:hypothetical protein
MSRVPSAVMLERFKVFFLPISLNVAMLTVAYDSSHAISHIRAVRALASTIPAYTYQIYKHHFYVNVYL